MQFNSSVPIIPVSFRTGFIVSDVNLVESDQPGMSVPRDVVVGNDNR